MFKEVVSTAIILGWVLNFAFVDHPDRKSYTIAFVISLLFECPFLAAWRYWWVPRSLERAEESQDGGEEGEALVERAEDVEAARPKVRGSGNAPRVGSGSEGGAV